MCCRTDTAPFTASTLPKTSAHWWASQLHNLLGLEWKWIVQLFSCRFYFGNSNLYAFRISHFSLFVVRTHGISSTVRVWFSFVFFFSFFIVHWLWIWRLSVCVCVMSLVYLQILDYAKRSLVHLSFFAVDFFFCLSQKWPQKANDGDERTAVATAVDLRWCEYASQTKCDDSNGKYNFYRISPFSVFGQIEPISVRMLNAHYCCDPGKKLLRFSGFHAKSSSLSSF